MEFHLSKLPFDATRISAVNIALVKDMFKNNMIKHDGVQPYTPQTSDDSWKNHVYHHRYMFVEFAVTLSHIKAIKKAYTDGQQIALIIEDDARISPAFIAKWRDYIATAPKNWEMLNLYTTNAQAISHLNRIDDPWVFWNAWYWGATAYIINRKGMEKIILHSFEGKYKFDEKIVVVDEYIASFTQAYQATWPLIYISGALSTQQISEVFLLDKTFSAKINSLIRQKQTKHIPTHKHTESLLIIVIGNINSKQIMEEMEYMATKHSNVHWAMIGSLNSVNHVMHLHSFDNIETYDYILIKDVRLSLVGFAWSTFFTLAKQYTITGAFVAHVDHFNLRKWTTHNTFDIFKLRQWAMGNRYDREHGRGAYGLLQPIQSDVVPDSFALLNGRFFQTYKQLNQNEWCGAAFLWNQNIPPCAMIPIGIHQLVENMEEKKTHQETNALWLYYSKTFRTKNMVKYFYQHNMVNKLHTLTFNNPLESQSIAIENTEGSLVIPNKKWIIIPKNIEDGKKLYREISDCNVLGTDLDGCIIFLSDYSSEMALQLMTDSSWKKIYNHSIPQMLRRGNSQR